MSASLPSYHHWSFQAITQGSADADSLAETERQPSWHSGARAARARARCRLREAPYTKYSCNTCDHIWQSKHGQSKSKVLYLIKSHIIHQHYNKNLEKGLNKNFKGNKCTLCGSTLGNKHGLKKHLIATHKYFDTMVSNDFDFVLANASEPNVEHGLKRKLVQSDFSELLQKSKMSKIDSSLGLGGEGRLKEDDNISHIQSRIEFSDSDCEDET